MLGQGGARRRGAPVVERDDGGAARAVVGGEQVPGVRSDDQVAGLRAAGRHRAEDRGAAAVRAQADGGDRALGPFVHRVDDGQPGVPGQPGAVGQVQLLHAVGGAGAGALPQDGDPGAGAAVPLRVGADADESARHVRASVSLAPLRRRAR